jgi:streptomycin 6-kinase
MTDTAPLTVPAEVMREVRTRWPNVADTWADSATAELQRFCDQYQAIPVRVMPSRSGLVVKANSPSGPLIFRYSPDPNGGAQATVAAALAALNIAPSVREAMITPYGTRTVLDWVTPGTPLGDAPTPPNPDQIAAMLGPMAGQPAPAGLLSLIDWLRDRLTDDHLADRAPGRSVAPLSERRAALALLDSLSCDHVPALCHGDASPWNILHGPADSLYLIDSRGIAGELAYDIAVIALKAERYVAISDTVSQLGDRLKVSDHRVKAWLSVARIAAV